MKASIRTFAVALAVAALFTAIAGFGLLDSPDGTVSDDEVTVAAASAAERFSTLVRAIVKAI